ncbi:MAG: IS630 family transposase [Rhodospirillales bacterium]|nr:IS630 family transposase [Rhodospirillales bacterium]
MLAKVPYGRWTTMTFLAALRHDRVDAPWLIEGPINGESFRLYIDKVLVPTLRPGDIVVMDNLGSHRSSAVRSALRAAGAKLFFLPKYSPDLNPIEMLFSKLKHGLRKAAKRTEDAVYDAIADLLPTVRPAECQNYFAKAGYART